MKNPVEMPDEKLLQFYLSNNPVAMATLTDLYKDRIYNTVYATVKNKYAAEIIFRDVFIRIMNNLIAGKNPENATFLQWATELVQHLCLEYNYKVTQENAYAHPCKPGISSSEQTTLPEKVYYDSHTRIRSMIYQLPDGQREVMIMSHYAGTSFRDIAAKMKCSVTNTLDLMAFALVSLRKLMTEEDLILT